MIWYLPDQNLGGSKPRWSQNDINGYLRKVMNLKSDTFGNPLFQKVLQN